MIDTVNNILSMKVDMVVMRHSASGAPHSCQTIFELAIINAGDGTNEHPTQALLDAFQIREKLSTLQGQKKKISHHWRYYAFKGCFIKHLLFKKIRRRSDLCRPPYPDTQTY